MIPFAFEKATLTIPAGAGGNSTLTNLVISAGTLVPVFAGGTINYTVSVANGVASMTVTPTGPGSGEVIQVDGKVVPSGSLSGAISLSVGSTVITVYVDGGSSTTTYTITVSRASASGNLPPNPSGLSFDVGNSRTTGNTSLTVSNPNATAMTISFGPWNIYKGTNQWSWITAWPLVIPANSSAQVAVRHLGNPFATNPSGATSAGTWACGADSGVISANAFTSS